MVMRNKDKKLLVYLFFAAYLFCLQNSLFNTHVHVLPDGSVVRHAHPFSHNNPNGHQHNHAEFHFYHGSSVSYFDTSDSGGFVPFLPSLFAVLVAFCVPRIHTAVVAGLRLRAPPSF
jgi:hypothetical protein